MVEEQEEEEVEEEVKVEQLEDKGGREVTQARVQLHQMQPTGNHSTPFKLILGALQSIAQIVFYPETRKWRTSVLPFVVAEKYEANKWNTSSHCRPCS